MAYIPAKYASKIGLYDVTVHSTPVKVRVVDNMDVVSLGLSELKSEMGENMVAGIMIKEKKTKPVVPQMMILCVKSRCLIIQVYDFYSIPKCLLDFVNDKKICFVGPAMNDTRNRLMSYYDKDTRHKYFPNPTVIDVGDLAGKILHDPTLLSKNQTVSKHIAHEMQSIADKAGVALEKDTINRADKPSIDLLALAFSREEIKLLVADVYASYLIATKLLDSL